MFITGSSLLSLRNRWFRQCWKRLLRLFCCVGAFALVGCGGEPNSASRGGGTESPTGQSSPQANTGQPSQPSQPPGDRAPIDASAGRPSDPVPSGGRKMELDKNGEVISEAATNDQIKAAIQSLEEDGFVILQEKEQFYVQISGNITGGFDLEYREGDASKHFRGTKDDYTTDEVISVFLKYNQGDDSWKDDAEWEKLTF